MGDVNSTTACALVPSKFKEIGTRAHSEHLRQTLGGACSFQHARRARSQPRTFAAYRSFTCLAT